MKNYYDDFITATKELLDNYRPVLHKYWIDKKGNVINKNTGKQIPSKIYKGKKMVRLYTWVEEGRDKCLWYDVASLLFFAFNPEYDKTKYMVVSRTGNYVDFTLEDLDIVRYETI